MLNYMLALIAVNLRKPLEEYYLEAAVQRSFLLFAAACRVVIT
jgi:hypothetical protein